MSTSDLHNDVTTDPSSFRTAGAGFAGFYALKRQLDANVWLAHDEVLGEDVSLHFAPAAIRQDDRALQELRQDFKKSRQLIHPNILRVHDLVEDPEGVAMSMEAFEGESLATHIDRQDGKGSTLSAIQSWAEPVIRTLEEAHKIHVLHRDLTPSNIFLTSAGKAFVANFGISRSIRDAQARAGESRPSAFTSPQLLDGKAATPADDVYSLGAIFYTAAVGKAPFAGDDIAQQVRAGLSAESLAALERAELPANWRTTILACLDRDPEARPQSAADLGRRLAVSPGDAASAPVEKPAAEATPAAPPAAPTPTPSEPELATAPDAVEPDPQHVLSAVVSDKPDAGLIESAGQTAGLSAEPTTEVKEPVTAASAAADAAAGPKASQPPADELKKDASPATPVLEKGANDPLSPDFAPGMDPDKARFRTTILIAAAVVIVVIVLIRVAIPGSPKGKPAVRPEQTRALTPAPLVPETPNPASVAWAEKKTALEKARQDAHAAEKEQDDLQKQQQAVEEGLASTEKNLEEKSASLKSMKKVAEELMARRKEMESDKNAAEMAANEARKLAADKARQFEESAAALKRFEEANTKSMAAPQLTEAEIVKLQKDADEQRRAMADGAEAVAAGEAALQQRLSAVADQEREVEKMKVIEQEAMRKKATEADARQHQEKDVPPHTPAPTPVVVMMTTPTPGSMTATPAPSPSVPTVQTSTTPAPNDGGNSLGMKFVPVGDVEFCIWLTRLKDFEVFAKAFNLPSTSWKTPGFKQGPDHPVVNVSWQESVVFCEWLTNKEHKDKTLAADKIYRLPTDLEWSKAVGLPEEAGNTPEKRDMGVPEVYPWGSQWPPPPGAGNYTGEETGTEGVKGYNDGFSWTSPVGSFPPNKYGLYDMGGNAWQWCMDTWNSESKNRVLRGASWYNGGLRLSLLSSCRINAAPNSSTDNYGFRVVRAKEAAKPGRK